MPEDIEKILELASPRRTCPVARTCFWSGLGCLLIAVAVWTAVTLWMDDGRHRLYRHYFEPTPYVVAVFGLTAIVSAITGTIRLVRRRRELRGWLWLIGGVGLTVVGLLAFGVGFFVLFKL
jgi:hypothetical protein